jgi:hypothetical protein
MLLLDGRAPLRSRIILAVPFLGPERPRSGRVLSRGNFGRATEPLRRVSAHSGHARYRGTTRRFASRPFAALRALHLSARPSLILGPMAFHPARRRPFPSDLARPRYSRNCRTALTRLGHRYPDSDACLGPLHCPGQPSPPISVRRCGGRGLRRNPPCGGSSTAFRSLPRRKRRLGCLRPLTRHQSRTPAGERPPPEQRKGRLTWLPSDP